MKANAVIPLSTNSKNKGCKSALLNNTGQGDFLMALLGIISQDSTGSKKTCQSGNSGECLVLQKNTGNLYLANFNKNNNGDIGQQEIPAIAAAGNGKLKPDMAAGVIENIAAGAATTNASANDCANIRISKVADAGANTGNIAVMATGLAAGTNSGTASVVIPGAIANTGAGTIAGANSPADVAAAGNQVSPAETDLQNKIIELLEQLEAGGTNTDVQVEAPVKLLANGQALSEILSANQSINGDKSTSIKDSGGWPVSFTGFTDSPLVSGKTMQLYFQPAAKAANNTNAIPSPGPVSVSSLQAPAVNIQAKPGDGSGSVDVRLINNSVDNGSSIGRFAAISAGESVPAPAGETARGTNDSRKNILQAVKLADSGKSAVTPAAQDIDCTVKMVEPVDNRPVSAGEHRSSGGSEAVQTPDGGSAGGSAIKDISMGSISQNGVQFNSGTVQLSNITATKFPSEILPYVLNAVSIPVKEDNRVSVIRLKLEPENMGEIKIRLSYSKGELSAHFYTDSGVVKDAVQCSLPQLRETLSQYNINLGDAAAYVGHERQNNSGARYAGYRSKERPGKINSILSERQSVEIGNNLAAADGSLDLLI